MEHAWYYVENKDRKGPIGQDEMLDLVKSGVLDSESYVWRKGFENWKKLKDVEELKLIESNDESFPEIIPDEETNIPEFSWDTLDLNERVIHIKVGRDRDGNEREYGPYCLTQLERMFSENRINGKTLVFTPGMGNWEYLSETPLYSRLTSEEPPVISDEDRRLNPRKPFIARLLFHDNRKVYEGICRDISEGGMQILVAEYPAKVGEQVTLNVHPDNSKYNFTAEGSVVRLLDGKAGFSMKFNSLKKDAQLAIKQYLNDV